MKSVIEFLYLGILCLWIGGMVIFTFVVTPAIFRSFGRDMAGEIVGKLFPGYFLYVLVLSGSGLLLFLLQRPGRGPTYWISLALLVMALVVNGYIFFKLHPDAVRVKQQVASFEREAADSPARKEFRRLHAMSAVLNLFVLLDGAALLALNRYLGRNG